MYRKKKWLARYENSILIKKTRLCKRLSLVVIGDLFFMDHRTKVVPCKIILLIVVAYFLLEGLM